MQAFLSKSITLLASLVILPAGMARAEDKPNPAPERFQEALVFYLSFDGESTAPDLSAVNIRDDSATPEAEEAVFAPGVFGKAYLPSGKRTPSYNMSASGISFERPGSAAFWVSPKAWDRGEPESYCFFLTVHAQRGQVMAAKSNQQGNSDFLYAHAQRGQGKGDSARAGSTQSWNDDEWHLLVLNWGTDSLSFSVDGRDFVHLSVPDLKEYGEWQRLFLPSLSSRNVAMDEVMVFDRPLELEEITQLYTEGLEGK